ncbi:MAG: hypothetical protein KJ621_18955 [Proteobacteria bacterium]|nr:hypothetical protein [Pseudomonadota bacterium]
MIEPRILIGALLVLGLLFWIILLWMRHTPISFEYLWPFSLVLSFLVAVWGVFNRYLWRLKILKGWFVKRPDLRGTWQVKLSSDSKDPDTGELLNPILCFLVVRQTFSSLSMRLITPESSSSLIASKLIRTDDGIFQVVGVYRNEPKLELRGVRSEIHYGALIINIHGDPPSSLDGEYWTDRKTKGTIISNNKTEQVCSTYQEAAVTFGKT